MSRAAVTQEEFAAFVEERGYQRQELWSPDGWAWREKNESLHPLYWKKKPGCPSSLLIRPAR